MMTYSVSATDAGLRVDVFLVRQGMEASRALIQRWLAEGHVLLNGATTKPSHKLKPGDVLVVDPPAQETDSEAKLIPWEFPLEVLYADESILAVNKPAGVVTHPGAGNRARTLVHAALAMYPELSGIGHPLRPGVVHRLDRETSGVLLLARTGASYYALSRMFKERAIEKHYRALSFGQWARKEGRIDQPLGRDSRDRKKISTRARKGRAAITLFQVLQQSGYASFLDVQILTGRTHQIRVHLAAENHPIVGDTKYGGSNWNRIPDPELRARLKSERFFGLHAYSLSFAHPISGKPLALECPLPDLWSIALKVLSA